MPTRISTKTGFDRTANAFRKHELAIARLQAQMASSKKVNSAKDDPVGIVRCLALQQKQAMTEQYQKNIQYAEGDLSTVETNMIAVTNEISSAKDLIIQANNPGVKAPADLRIIANQLSKIRDELLSVANNTSPDGQYLFNGGAAGKLAVIQDPSTGKYIYNGDEYQRNAQIGNSLTINTSYTAKNIFFGLNTNDVAVAAKPGQASVISGNSGGLVDVGTLGVVTTDTLQINGIAIAPAVADGVSTTDQTGSAFATATAINKSTALHGVIAKVNPNAITFTGGTYTTDPLVAGDFTINGVQIIGAPPTADARGLVDLINLNVGVPEVVVSVNGGELRLTAADGRNIQLQTNGVAAGMNFTNFATSGGEALHKVQKSTFTLYSAQEFTVTGSITEGSTGVIAGRIGLASAVTPVQANTGSGVISQPKIVAVNDKRANNDVYFVKFETDSRYNIYKGSNPQKPLLANSANYVAGAQILVEGLQFTITGTPAANDTFTVSLTPTPPQNTFDALQNAIDALNNYTGSAQNEELNYKMQLALSNLKSAEEQAIEVNTEVGCQLKLADIQSSSNDEFIFFAQKGISETVDVNPSSVISELLSYQTAYEASQLVAKMILGHSLFDLL